MCVLMYAHVHAVFHEVQWDKFGEQRKLEQAQEIKDYFSWENNQVLFGKP